MDLGNIINLGHMNSGMVHDQMGAWSHGLHGSITSLGRTDSGAV